MINNFQAIQTAVIYKKNTYEMFKHNGNMFLYLKESFDQNIKLSKERITFFIISQIFARVVSFCLGIRQRLLPNSYF